MSRLRRTVRHALEKALGQFKEGPECPGRMLFALERFGDENPTATGQWLEVASAAVRDAYAEGFMRGLEVSIRNPDAFRQDWEKFTPPEEPDIVSLRTSFATERDPKNPLRGVPPEHRAEFLDLLGMQAGGGFRVVKIPGKGER